jgi:hypothetical protein
MMYRICQFCRRIYRVDAQMLENVPEAARYCNEACWAAAECPDVPDGEEER